MLERGSYIPWASRFKQFLNRKRENQKWLLKALEDGPYVFRTITPIVNTKFLNSLQPEWLKYVTQVRLAKKLTVDSFDDLFDYLSQFEKLVNASRAKKLEKSHDPLALVAYTGSSSRNTPSYYVTHLSSVVDYNEVYEQYDVYNHSEDLLASAMLLLAKSITQNFSNLTNNCLCASFNTKNQAVVQGDRVNIQSRNSGLFELRLQAILQRVNAITAVEKDIMLGIVPSQGTEEIEELSANICLMARIQPANQNSDDK
ncbi:hypothetical protein Tco_0947800, partial [Tanacetum coccineum]